MHSHQNDVACLYTFVAHARAQRFRRRAVELRALDLGLLLVRCNSSESLSAFVDKPGLSCNATSMPDITKPCQQRGCKVIRTSE